MGHRGETRRILVLTFTVVALTIVLVVAGAIWKLFEVGAARLDDGSIDMAVTVMLALAFASITGLWICYGVLDSHFDDLERLRAAVLVASVSPDGRLPPPREDLRVDEVSRVREAVETLILRRLFPSATPDERLTAVLATLEEGILVVTDQGQVSLSNTAARVLLGAEPIRVGSSAFAALERDDLVAAMADAEAHRGGAVDVTLRGVDGQPWLARVHHLTGHSGFVVRITATPLSARTVRLAARDGVIQHDLSLLDSLPEAAAADDTPLFDLPVFVFDSETTGLDIHRDRIVSVGGVRVHGTRIFHIANIDRLVNPGIPIPASAAAIHGITDEVAADAPPFADAWPALEPLLRGAVLVGHNIGFDLALLRRECALAGLPAPAPPQLDTLLLAGLLFPDMTDLNLETLCQRLGVDVHGRHTALGDALVTAELYVRLLPLLDAAGVKTLADAHAYTRKATHLLARQRAMGW